MRHLLIDGCSICQLKCPQCPVTQMGYTNTIGKGYLTLYKFKEILEKNPGTTSVDFDNFGELFLNPELFDILGWAAEQGIRMECSGGVNLNDVKPRDIKAMVLTKFRYLNISIDGASQETYRKYRVGGDFNKVIKNIHEINGIKREWKSPYPKLQWQFVVFGHNEHELPKAKKMAAELGMRFYPKLNWNSTYSPIKDPEFVKRETGWKYTTREEFEEKTGESYVRNTCMTLWTSPRISWDGAITGCCWNVWKRFDEKMLAGARDSLITGKIPPYYIPCLDCEIYHNLIRRKTHLFPLEVLGNIARSRAVNMMKLMVIR